MTVPRAAPAKIVEGGIDLPERALNVLVVDDDPLVLSNTGAMLEDLGHNATMTASGEAALAELRRRRFDVMLTDHAMPHMTGAQLVREVGTAYPHMAIIIATGFADLPDHVSALTRLGKPYAQADLVEALAKSCPAAPSLYTAGGGTSITRDSAARHQATASSE
jgi:CheY-like chemotaxis protein